MTEPAHAIYAQGFTAFDDAAWPAAVGRLLAATSTVTEEVQVRRAGQPPTKEKVTRTVHETDPPPSFQPKPRVARPGALPALVAAAPKGAKTEEHFHMVEASPKDLALALYHMARVVVTEARRRNASSIALKPIAKNADGTLELGVVLVLR